MSTPTQRFLLCGLLAGFVVADRLHAAVSVAEDFVLTADDLSLENQEVLVRKATLTVLGSHTFAGLQLLEGAVLTHPGATNGEPDHAIRLTVNGNVVVDSTSRIDASGRGYATGAAPGAGTVGAPFGAGGGHGGEGGKGSGNPGTMGGAAIGSIVGPNEWGGPGGASGASAFAAGGGLIRLTVSGSLRVDGSIVANGTPAWINNQGGGAGGGIHLTVGSLLGSGTVAANGGAGEWVDGGGGAGGRIAIHHSANSFTGHLSVFGGGGHQHGGAGTLFLKDAAEPIGLIVVDNGDHLGAHTPINWPDPLHLAIGGQAQVYPPVNLTVQSLEVRTNGILTHPTGLARCEVTVLGDAKVLPGGRISVDGRGYPIGDDSGPGVGGLEDWAASGGGHGGEGGLSATGRAGGPGYGSITEPTTLGSQGGSSATGPGTAGGGVVRLRVNGRLTVDGQISANASSVPPPNNAGGGAGGSLWLTVGSLAGSGSIAATGGPGEWVDGGGGSGGRIALYHSGSTFSGSITAFGGGGHQHGGAGTLFLKDAAEPIGLIVVDNGDHLGAHTPINWPDPLHLAIGGQAQVYPPVNLTVQSLEVRTNGILTHPTGLARCEVTVLGDAKVLPGGRITVDGRGYPIGDDSGPGVGGLEDWAASGGGHGGEGGLSATGRAGGPGYGSITEPTTLGSQGGSSATGPGTAGGGVVRLRVNGRLTVDGQISANASSVPPPNNAGGGAGGSLWLTVGSLAGSGSIAATGGPGEWVDGGGGSGGRIALYHSGSTFSGSITAFGGGGHQHGGAGTLFLKDAAEPIGLIVVDNGDHLGAHTPINWPDPLHLAIGGQAQVYPPVNLTVQSLEVRTNGILTHPTGLARCEVTVLGDAKVLPGGRITVDGRGYPIGDDSGPGVGGLEDWAASGGGHGGEGGLSATGRAGGPGYGSITEPTTLGSQGGSSATGPGTAGGGVVRLRVNGRLTVDGQISANASSVPPPNNAGGGAGGSLWLTVGSLAGSGSIAATGGPGEWVDGGGGSGGRIALYHSGSTFSGSITAFGGGGHQRGGAGTLFLKAATESTGQIIVHNGGVLGGHTPIEWPDPLHLSLGGLAQVYPPSTLVLRQLDVLTNGILTHPVGRTRCDVVVLGDATVHPGGRVSVDGRGYPWGSDPGPGAGRLVDWAGSGAGHGGTGGRSVTGTPGGPAYGSALEPATLGSQGGNGNGGSGSPGGGAVRLLVGGTLTVDGEVSARGINAIANNAGGGSGGSLLLGARVLAGSGLITASGGNGEWLEGGGGSGGRIALLHGAGSFAGTLSNEGGVGADRGESGSIVVDSAPRVFWLTPTEPWLHGTVPLEVGIFSGGTGPYSVRFSARQGGIETPIATVSATLLGTATWDSTVVVDGTYELHAIVRDTAGLVIDDVHRTVQVNNSVQWEGGILMGAATWLPDRVHVVSRDLVIPAGAQLTLAPGTIVKFLPGIRLILESAGILNAAGSAGAPVVLTSFLDDSAGGDSNLDGPASRPVAGSWRLIERAGATLSLNEHTVFRYHSRVYGGLLAGDETWSAETLREISETVVVPGGATLRLEAGVILKFNRDQGITVRDGGTLEVAGTAPLPVVFTSIADDAYGGDTNGDGTRSNPATGDWRSVRFENGSTGLLDHVEIRFGGNSVGNPWGAGGAIESLGGPLTVRNTVISDALKDGAFCYGTTRFENCLVLRCDRGLTAVGDMEVVHCTVDECRIGLLEHVGRLTVRNSIVSRSIDSGIEHDLGSGVAVVTFCNVWNPNAGRGNYSGLTDRTGTNGNISQEPLYKDSEFDNFRLGFASPGIDAADGTVASATDLAGASRYDDPRTTNTGSAAANGAPPDMGALEFVETAPSNIDLVVTRVEGPSRLTAGGLVQVEWTIANRGSEPFRGPWHDAVYLQPIGGGSRLWVAEPLVGRGLVVGPGETQRLSADVRVPGGLIDGYQWTVVGNSRGDLVEGVNTANNQASSATTSELIVPELVVDGAAVQAAFTAPEETHWFVCRAPVGHDVRLRLDLLAESGVTEVYAGHGFVPTPDRFTARQREFGAPDSSLVVSGSVDPSPDGTNVFYIAAVGRVLAATPESFRIEAQGAGFQIESVAPARAGSSGLVTLEIRGSGLDANTAFAVRLGTLERPAVRISARESGRVFATFDLTEFPAGLAQVTATQGGLSIALPDAIEVVSGGNADFYATLEGPEVTRAGRLTTWFVTYGNRGLIDVRLPLLRFSAPGATEIRLFDHTANWADAFTFLALNPNVLLPTLGPGQEVTLEVRLKVARPTRISLQHLPGDQLVVDDTPFRWSSIPVPAGANAANWASMLATLPRRLGATVADYVSLLERDLGERRKSMLSYSYLANVNGRWLTGDEQEGTPVEYPIIEISAEEAAAADAVGPALQGPPARPPADGIRKTWFLYFVIGDYSLRRAEGGGGGDVTATRKDAVDVNEYLTHELRVPPAQISGGYDAPGDNAAWNRANILAQLTKFAGQIDADDNLVIVYSGHGGRGPNAGTGFLCPNGGGSISPTAFTRAIDQVGAGTTYFINNSCHSEAFNELVRPSNTRFVGFAATRRDRVAFADSASGSPAISFLKAQLRKCRGLGTAFEITELLVAHKHSKNAIEKHRQHPVLHNPSGVDLAGKPWNDPAGLEQELERMFNEADFPEWDSTDLGIVGSIDPNDKYALAGAGPERWVHPGQALPYEVVFENKTNAPAAAQEVLVFDDLDPRYDWSTFELKSIAFNDAKIDVPPGLQRHTTTATVGTDTNEVAVEVSFNPATGRITWLLRSVDANTGDLPEDPYAGFLPPNDAAHRGEGSLTYTVRPKADLPDGTQLTNLATIIFDPTYGANPPIVTPMVTNTLDRFAPSSRIGALDASVTREFAVTWSGEDPPNGSGVASYDVHVSRDDGSYTLWQVATTNTTAGFSGQPGSTYRFFSIARDAAGNTELAPGEPDAVTTVTGGVTFTDWARIQSFPLSLAGPEQDPDNDGLPNFAEYALALNPMADDAEQAVPGAGLVEIAGQWYLTLTYRHPKADPPDVRYRVTASRNARPWDRSAMYLPMGTPIDRGTHVEVTVRAIEPIGFRNRGFLRIEITEGANP